MTLVDLLEMHRAHYLDHFVQSLVKAHDGASEILLEMDNYVPDPIYRLYRPDYVRNVKGQLQLMGFNLSAPMDHAVFKEQRGALTVEVRPFVWHECIVQVYCERYDRKALEGWITHWLDVEDTKERDEDGLKQVIHYITPPTYPMGKLAFLVDFGTAPVQAVLELVRVLGGEQGTTQIVLGAVI
jgi:hypothetical protein